MEDHLSRLPQGYVLDESDPDILVLRRQDGSFVAAFSAMGATSEEISRTAGQDHLKRLTELLPQQTGSRRRPA
jgi:hypothetical protein